MINDAASPMSGAARGRASSPFPPLTAQAGASWPPPWPSGWACRSLTASRQAGQAPTQGRGESLCAEEAGSTPVHRLLGSLTHAMPAGPAVSPPSYRLGDDEIRQAAETEVLALAAAGRGWSWDGRRQPCSVANAASMSASTANLLCGWPKAP